MYSVPAQCSGTDWGCQGRLKRWPCCCHAAGTSWPAADGRPTPALPLSSPVQCMTCTALEKRVEGLSTGWIGMGAGVDGEEDRNPWVATGPGEGGGGADGERLGVETALSNLDTMARVGLVALSSLSFCTIGRCFDRSICSSTSCKFILMNTNIESIIRQL